MYFEEKSPGEVQTTLAPECQVLLDAADVIRKQGWIQGSYHCGSYVCMMGAVCYAISKIAVPYKLPANKIQIFIKAERRLGIFLNEMPANWNDAPGRTKEQVIAALEGAARS